MRVLLAIVLVACICGAYLFSPRLPEGPRAEKDHFTRYVELAPSIGVHVSGDAKGFIAGALRPAALLEPDTMWQSRPLFVLLGSALRIPFEPFWPTPRIPEEIRTDYARLYGHIQEVGEIRFAAVYLGYVTFNLAVLVVAVTLYWSVVGGSCRDACILGSLGALLVANDVAKTYVWTPHLQMLVILQPVLLVWLVVRVGTRPSLGVRRFTAYGLAAGFLVLGYGSFLLLLPGLLVGLLLRRWRPGCNTEPLREGLMIGLGAVSFLLPYLAWIAFVNLYVGSFYSHETVQFRQFVWMLDALRDEGPTGFMNRATTGLAVFGRQCLVVGWPAALLVALAAGMAAATGRLRSTLDRSWLEVAAALTALAVNLSFFGLAGYYSERLTFAIVPPLVVLLGVLVGGTAPGLTARRSRLLGAVVVIGAAWWTCHMIAKPGPWSYKGKVRSVTRYHDRYAPSALEAPPPVRP